MAQCAKSLKVPILSWYSHSLCKVMQLIQFLAQLDVSLRWPKDLFFLRFWKKNLATKIYSTKICIYNQQEIDWKCFQVDPIRSTNWKLSLKLGKLFFFFLLLWAISKHKNDLGHLKETSNWAKNWISCITFHKEWEYQLKIGTFKLLAHTYRPWATLNNSVEN